MGLITHYSYYNTPLRDWTIATMPCIDKVVPWPLVMPAYTSDHLVTVVLLHTRPVSSRRFRRSIAISAQTGTPSGKTRQDFLDFTSCERLFRSRAVQPSYLLVLSRASTISVAAEPWDLEASHSCWPRRRCSTQPSTSAHPLH